MDGYLSAIQGQCAGALARRVLEKRHHRVPRIGRNPRDLAQARTDAAPQTDAVLRLLDVDPSSSRAQRRSQRTTGIEAIAPIRRLHVSASPGAAAIQRTSDFNNETMKIPKRTYGNKNIASRRNY
jgi:hypothetical protein